MYVLQCGGLQKYLNEQGFHIVGYGCTTYIGNSGELDELVTAVISENDIVAAAVLSGNLNFEGRGHPLTRVDIDFNKKPIVVGKDGKDVYFKDIWSSTEEIAEVVQSSLLPNMFKSTYEAITKGNAMWNHLSVPIAKLYSWDPNSTYIHEPPYFKNMTMDPPRPNGVKDANCLLNFGDSITTDHISPAGSIHKDRLPSILSSMGLIARTSTLMGVVRLKIDINMLEWTLLPWLEPSTKAEALEIGLRKAQCCWQGVKAVIAKSFERIHRSNLVGMGIVPLYFKSGEDADTLGLTGHERYTIDLPIRPGNIFFLLSVL
ncbi:unnamed protein product [Fraxinus pennsylvanica]|uniref:Aconitate hydratase n=1 Tax=Fraxinus pennsylvanica TaxID=56036 RepID=A0AAD1YZP1_9LAMI|nr:unnamed protein product [Fraxinus pennsylvanica]